MMTRGRWPGAAATAVLALFAALSVTPTVHVAPEEVPPRLSDGAFWRMVVDFSEPGGFFRSDNLVSNETEFQHVVPDLQKKTAAGGVYVGVGPDQNFTYIS